MPPDANYAYAQAFDRRAGGHHGTDIFAPLGTPVLAVVTGDVTRAALNEGIGGNVVYLKGDGMFGRKIYYAHLDSIEPDLLQGHPVHVQAGDVLGYVGNTGNAAKTDPHLHIQVSNPNGLSITDPFPHLQDVDPKAGGASRPDPDHEPAAVEATVVDDDLLLFGGAAVALVVVLWLVFKDDKKRRAA